MNKILTIIDFARAGLTYVFPIFAAPSRVQIKKAKASVQGSRTTSKKSIFESLTSPRLSVRDQAFFAKRLAFLTKAGVTLLESFYILREQAPSKSYAKIIDQIISDTSNGQTIAKSLAKFPSVFGDFAVNIIKVGESSGTLSQNLDYLADELKKKQLLRRKVMGALMYPIFITLATLGITGMLTVFIFPKIMPIFTSMNITLPLSTRIVLAVSVFLRSYGLLLFVGLVAFGFAFAIVRKRVFRIRLAVDHAMLRLPVVGTVMQYYNLANSSRTLGLLLKSGMTLTEALPIAADTTNNLVYKKQFMHLAKAVTRGEKMSVHLTKSKQCFPVIVGQMVAVGERSGKLSDTLVYLSELYEHEVDEFTKNLSSMIEPILMVTMGVLVGFVAISVITPIYGITQHFQVR